MQDQTPEASRLRRQMTDQIKAHGVRDERILAAFRKVPRHRFLPQEIGLREAYGDHPIPIGHGQTISQPYIVAYMTAALDPQPGEKVLDVGTGSGYQAAILAALGVEVYSIDVVPELVERAREALEAAGLEVHLRHGDGRRGWPEAAPFDGIVAACAAAETPDELLDQLGEGAMMILPEGTGSQSLVRYVKKEGEVERQVDLPVRFVPMV